MDWLFLVCLSIAAIAFYRLGGETGYDTKFRDWGVSLLLVIFFFQSFKHLHQLEGYISSALMFLLSWGANSSYFKKGPDMKWKNWFFVGLANGLALFPIAYALEAWWAYVVRTIVLAFLVPYWCTMKTPLDKYKDGNVLWSEGGRGFWYLLTCGFFLLWRVS